MIFGPEFTFCDLETENPEKMEKIEERFRRHLIEEQPEGARFTLGPENRYTSPNGWWFEWKYENDFRGRRRVMEVVMNPQTVSSYRHFKDDMQDAIFASAANEGVFPALWQGGGHINFSLEVFKNDDLLLRNFIVDMINHNELFMGVFNYDTNNALPFALIPDAAKAEVYETIRQFDRGDFAGFQFPYGAFQFISKIETARASKVDRFLRYWVARGIRLKHFDLGLHFITNRRRIEIRGVRPQASMDVWIRQIDLIEHRLRYLKTFRHPIEILAKVPLLPIDFGDHALNPPVDPQLALRSFYRYVTESGLRFQDHTDYLWPQWISGGEVQKFEASEWFKTQEQKRNCQKNLAESA